MNEAAIRLEEQIISLFPDKETEVCHGWVLKQLGSELFIHPLYTPSSGGDILNYIQECEEISQRRGSHCVFRIVEHTNYHLSSLLTDNGYKLQRCCVVGELYMIDTDSHLHKSRSTTNKSFSKFTYNCYSKRRGKTNPYNLSLKKEESKITENIITGHSTVLGIKRQELLFLPNGYGNKNKNENEDLPDGISLEDILQFSLENGIVRILADIPNMEELPEQYKRAGFIRSYLYRCYFRPLISNKLSICSSSQDAGTKREVCTEPN